jgi:hypothetical protein
MLSKLDDHQTLTVCGGYLHIDDRMLQFVRRAFGSDNRFQICEAVETTGQKIDEMLKTYVFLFQLNCKDLTSQCCQQFESLKTKMIHAHAGLKKLRNFLRYKNDADFQIRIEKSEATLLDLIHRSGNFLKLADQSKPNEPDSED